MKEILKEKVTRFSVELKNVGRSCKGRDGYQTNSVHRRVAYLFAMDFGGYNFKNKGDFIGYKTLISGKNMKKERIQEMVDFLNEKENLKAFFEYINLLENRSNSRFFKEINFRLYTDEGLKEKENLKGIELILDENYVKYGACVFLVQHNKKNNKKKENNHVHAIVIEREAFDFFNQDTKKETDKIFKRMLRSYQEEKRKIKKILKEENEENEKFISYYAERLEFLNSKSEMIKNFFFKKVPVLGNKIRVKFSDKLMNEVKKIRKEYEEVVNYLFKKNNINKTVSCKKLEEQARDYVKLLQKEEKALTKEEVLKIKENLSKLNRESVKFLTRNQIIFQQLGGEKFLNGNFFHHKVIKNFLDKRSLKRVEEIENNLKKELNVLLTEIVSKTRKVENNLKKEEKKRVIISYNKLRQDNNKETKKVKNVGNIGSQDGDSQLNESQRRIELKDWRECAKNKSSFNRVNWMLLRQVDRIGKSDGGFNKKSEEVDRTGFKKFDSPVGTFEIFGKPKKDFGITKSIKQSYTTSDWYFFTEWKPTSGELFKSARSNLQLNKLVNNLKQQENKKNDKEETKKAKKENYKTNPFYVELKLTPKK